MKKQPVHYSLPGNKKWLLLHYKAIGAKLDVVNTQHTNSWEISEIIRSSLSLGLNVELVDRAISDWAPTREYALFISNASGSLGPRFVQMAKQIQGVKTILYAAGPASDISDGLVNARYLDFRKRNHIEADSEPLRVYKNDIDLIMSLVDEVICIDDNGFSSETYSRFKKPMHSLRPSSPPEAFDGRISRFTKNTDTFMLFLGNGFIAKGADVVLEALMNFPKAKLEICGPYRQDSFFWRHFKNKVKKMPNVSLNGFVTVGSRQYLKLIGGSAWQLHNSAAEGCATSVTTLIQGGVLPITNFETGVDVEGYGIEIPNVINGVSDTVSSTAQCIERALAINQKTMLEMMRSLYLSAEKYSRGSFRLNFMRILNKLTS